MGDGSNQALIERIDKLEHIVMLLVKRRNIATTPPPPSAPPRPASRPAPVLPNSPDISELKKTFLSYRQYTDTIIDALKAFTVIVPITDPPMIAPPDPVPFGLVAPGVVPFDAVLHDAAVPDDPTLRGPDVPDIAPATHPREATSQESSASQDSIDRGPQETAAFPGPQRRSFLDDFSADDEADYAVGHDGDNDEIDDATGPSQLPAPSGFVFAGGGARPAGGIIGASENQYARINAITRLTEMPRTPFV